MKNYRLKFNNQEQWLENIDSVIITDEDGSRFKDGYSVVVLGHTFRDDGELDANGNITKEPTPREGFLVDILCEELPEELKPFDIGLQPVHPVHKFAGC
jgi:hypothetical protein